MPEQDRPATTSSESDLPELVIKLPIDDELVLVANKSLLEICEAMNWAEEDTINICSMIAKYQNVLRLAHCGFDEADEEKFLSVFGGRVEKPQEAA